MENGKLKTSIQGYTFAIAYALYHLIDEFAKQAGIDYDEMVKVINSVRDMPIIEEEYGDKVTIKGDGCTTQQD